VPNAPLLRRTPGRRQILENGFSEKGEAQRSGDDRFKDPLRCGDGAGGAGAVGRFT
jgi:hypothetical protein